MVEKLLSKIGMSVFLFLIVIGFTIPSFLNVNNSEPVQAAARLCQADADCYLMCDTPKEVLCYQNLCQQKSCSDQVIYPFQQTSVSFALKVMMNGQQIKLPPRSNSRNLFVTFQEEMVTMFSPVLSLNQVLDKVEIRLEQSCFYLDGVKNCNDGTHQVRLMVNGVESQEYGDYLPAQNDVVEIVYS